MSSWRVRNSAPPPASSTTPSAPNPPHDASEQSWICGAGRPPSTNSSRPGRSAPTPTASSCVHSIWPLSTADTAFARSTSGRGRTVPQHKRPTTTAHRPQTDRRVPPGAPRGRTSRSQIAKPRQLRHRSHGVGHRDPRPGLANSGRLEEQCTSFPTSGRRGHERAMLEAT